MLNGLHISLKSSFGFCKTATLLGGISDFEKMKDYGLTRWELSGIYTTGTILSNVKLECLAVSGTRTNKAYLPYSAVARNA